MKFLEAYEKGIEIAKSKAKAQKKHEASSVKMYHNGFLFVFVNERGDLNFVSHILYGIEFMESNQWEVEDAN